MDYAKLKIVCSPSCSFCIMYRKKASLACKQTLVKYHFHERNKLKLFSKSLQQKNKIKFAGKKEINRNSEEERENLRRKNFKLLKNNESNDWIIRDGMS